ncbi:hypothetical protein HNP38_001636 [Chryseobacterium defluvii]|uniref:Uncharacterized protein n=1 Tax=Chryseobacterium defluvii TaxID=160396 RepID=A0A840KF59_9FLAO|nr:hypothetical protein [Chryseobacterium defluvii]
MTLTLLLFFNYEAKFMLSNVKKSEKILNLTLQGKMQYYPVYIY